MRAATPFLQTGRLLLRQWRESDLQPFAALNADPDVMRFFPAPLSRVESDALARRLQRGIAERGFGLWAAEAHFTPAVEIGWRFAREFWGNGYATEAAGAVMEYAFAQLSLTEGVSFTSRSNARSRRVMARIGMTHRAEDDFDHPLIAPGHPLRAHVLYRRARGSG